MNKRDQDFAKFILSRFDVNINEDEIDWNSIQNEFTNSIKKQETKPGLMYINWCIANYFGLDSLLVQSGKKRDRELTQPRQICYYIAHKEYKYTQQSIADFFGGDTVNGTKNHSTILSGIKRTENLMDTEKDYKELILKLIEKIKYGNNHQGTDTKTSTGSIQKSTEQQGNNMPVYGNREIESSDRFYQGEPEDRYNPDNIPQNQSAGELEEGTE